MDSNLMNCPTCGHSVNTAAGACAYCGAIVSEGEQTQQSEEKLKVEEPQAVESAAPPQQAETPPTAAISDEASDTPAADPEQADSETADQTPQVPEPAGLSETETAAVPIADSKPLSVGETFEYKFTDDGGKVEADSESSRHSPAASDDSESALTEDVVPESKPEAGLEPVADPMPADIESVTEIETQFDQPAPVIYEENQTEPAADEIQVSAELETLDTSDDKPAEPVTPEEAIREAVDTEDVHQEPATKTPAEPPAPTETMGDDIKTADKVDITSTIDPVMPVKSKSESTAEASEETILLDVADEVQIPPENSMGETAQIESPAAVDQTDVKPVDESAKTQPAAAEILKIEKAARDMAEAIEKQKASALEAKKAKEQALKKQKAALEKARAQKKQKMIMAKAAALKRKKAAQAKAQALKRQQADQVAMESVILEQAAAAKISVEGSQPNMHRCTKAGNKMQGLLEKYKGQAIGINYDNSDEIKEAQLIEANGDFFSVFVEDQKLHYSYPLKTIFTIIEGQNGVDTDDSEQQNKFNAVIKVYPLVHI